MRPQTGFSLIEIMIVIAIIGILTAIAMPMYNDYIVRGKIPDATSNLATKRVQMEQYFQDNRYYIASVPLPDPLPASHPCIADTTTSKYFNFSCPSLTKTTYTLNAVGKDTMAGFTYTIDDANAKTTTVPSDWPAYIDATRTYPCWITAKGGSC